MSENKLFCKFHPFLFFIIFVFGLLSPLSLFADQRVMNDLKAQMEETKNLIETIGTRLDNCRGNCVRQCRNTPGGNHAQCNNENCDLGACASVKKHYDENKKHLGDLERKLAELQERENPDSENEEDNEDDEDDEDDEETDTGEGVEDIRDATITQVKRGKEKTDAAAYLGVATTGYIGYEMYSCCSSRTCSSAWCAALVGFFGAAAWQTAELFKQRDKLIETEVALCKVHPNTPGCDGNPGGPGDGDGDGDGDDDDDDDDDPLPPLPPSCQNLPGSNCLGLIEAIQPPPDPTLSPGPGFSPAQVRERALELFKPKEGWPKGTFKKGEGFDYKKLSPEQKKQMDALLGKVNKMNQGFLADAMGDDESESGAGAEGIHVAGNSEGQKGGGFAGGDSTPSSSSGSVASGGGGSKKKKPDLTQQMRALLNKFRGNGDKDPLAKKSVSFGSDVVGVAEDNIFMMVHRRHRALEDQKFFITKSF